MSIQAPPRLLELAGQSLVRNEALAISALKELPTELYPGLFMEAFAMRCSKTVKAMVQTWPFTRLPLGALMKTPDLETLRAVLQGLDALLDQEVHPRRWSIQVLDLRNVDEDFWVVWSGAPVSSLKAMSKRQTEEDCPRMRRKQSLKVFVDLCLEEKTLDEFLTYLFLWFMQRNDLVHLCCRKLKIYLMPIQNITKVLKMVDLDCIQEVEVDCTWKLSTLERFVPYLGQMSHLHKLLLSHIYVSDNISQEKKEEFVSQLTSQFLKLDCLQKLHMDSVPFLEGHLDQVLRCLKTPLETLSITNCLLSESDLRQLSQCPSISQLKELDLSGIKLANFVPETLQLLLGKVAATLQTLDLDECGITDTQLRVILPALSRCSQLKIFSFRGNPISMAALETLLRHTVRLSKLHLEMYDAPLESYGAQGALCQTRFAQLRAELIQMLRDSGNPKTVVFSTVP
ncbi:PREDICTED: PRAME family member 12-like [Propithecus coquereli]|nr:PREDICTED: PRAME family member 12-like [Propithecus coquereli]